MAQFLNPALVMLNRIYRFVGQQVSTDKLELGGSVQLVHDVSREAELTTFNLESRTPGYYHVGADNVHGAADTQNSATTPYSSLNTAFGTDPPTGTRFNLYLVALGVQATVNQLTAARINMRIPLIGAAFPIRDHLLGSFTTLVPINSLDAVFPFAASVVVPDFQPIFWPVGTGLGFQSITAAAATIRMTAIFWFGPNGAPAPGFR